MKRRRRMNPLFNRVEIFAVIEHQKQELKKAFQSVTNGELDADPIAVAARLIEQFSINVPVLDEDKKYALTKETQVDVRANIFQVLLLTQERIEAHSNPPKRVAYSVD
jgi:hypothetical protein